MTTRGWKVNPPLLSGLLSQPSGWQVGSRAGGSTSGRVGLGACLRDSGPSASHPICLRMGPLPPPALWDPGRQPDISVSQMAPLCHGAAHWGEAQGSQACPGTFAQEEVGPWRGSKGFTATGMCLEPWHCPLTDSKGDQFCYTSWTTTKQKLCKVP